MPPMQIQNLTQFLVFERLVQSSSYQVLPEESSIQDIRMPISSTVMYIEATFLATGYRLKGSREDSTIPR